MPSASRVLLLAVLCIVLTTKSIHADIQRDCTQVDDWWLRISACTEAIESSRWTGTRASWAYSNRAVAHAELGNYLAAFDDHEKAVSLNPVDAVARNNKGNSHARFREYDRAIREYTAAITLRAGYTNALAKPNGAALCG